MPRNSRGGGEDAFSRAALELGSATATDKNLLVEGGANIIRQYPKAGGGVRLFEGLDFLA